MKKEALLVPRTQTEPAHTAAPKSDHGRILVMLPLTSPPVAIARPISQMINIGTCVKGPANATHISFLGPTPQPVSKTSNAFGYFDSKATVHVA